VLNHLIGKNILYFLKAYVMKKSQQNGGNNLKYIQEATRKKKQPIKGKNVNNQVFTKQFVFSRRQRI